MHLMNKIKAVNKVFRQLETHISGFKEKSELSCVSNCGLCCSKPNIDATILEFLPAAYALYLSGKYEDIINNIEDKKDDVCVFYNPFSKGWSCSNYMERGLVCRLFGFSARENKHNKLTLVTCKSIKSSIDVDKLQNKLKYAPKMSSYYMKLFGIEPKLAIEYFPINQSIKKALEIVILHFRYAKKPA